MLTDVSPAITPTSTLEWHVAHTRPRREKKLAEYCAREGFLSTLPCYKSVKRYRGKVAVFLKPLFPNYLFLQLRPEQKQKVYQSDHVANLLKVPDPDVFEQQLKDILAALDTEVEVRLAPQVQAGIRVKIKSGPLRGLEGWVESRSGMSDVFLRLDFIQQAASVKIHADDLELI
ncbi:MAG: antitermination protein NusG [Verrucomicrobia bacterium]|nr:antitermination protein NusG [Verrucomicrobiota bacterium]